MIKFIKSILFIVLGVLLGILAERNKELLINAQFIRDHWHFRKPIDNKSTIFKSEKTMVCFTIGQSNAANYGNGSYVPKNEVYNYYKGELYQAKEPLLGADGAGCSVWTRVADMLIDSGLYDKVIIVPCALGSTSVECWSDGKCSEKLAETLDYLQKDNIRLTHILWAQGETDNVDSTSKSVYKQRLEKVINKFRTRKIDAPFYIAVSGYFPYANNNPFGIDKEITDAQTELPNDLKNVKAGPNTDSLNLAYYRADAVHFTEAGLDKLAYKWFLKIKSTTNH